MFNINFSDIPLNALSNMELSVLLAATIRNLRDLSGIVTDLTKCLSDEQLKHISTYDDLASWSKSLKNEL